MLVSFFSIFHFIFRFLPYSNWGERIRRKSLSVFSRAHTGEKCTNEVHSPRKKGGKLQWKNERKLSSHFCFSFLTASCCTTFATHSPHRKSHCSVSLTSRLSSIFIFAIARSATALMWGIIREYSFSSRILRSSSDLKGVRIYNPNIHTTRDWMRALFEFSWESFLSLCLLFIMSRKKEESFVWTWRQRSYRKVEKFKASSLLCASHFIFELDTTWKLMNGTTEKISAAIKHKEYELADLVYVNKVARTWEHFSSFFHSFLLQWDEEVRRWNDNKTMTTLKSWSSAQHELFISCNISGEVNLRKSLNFPIFPFSANHADYSFVLRLIIVQIWDDIDDINVDENDDEDVNEGKWKMSRKLTNPRQIS